MIVRMARENPNWRYNRIQGAVANLGHTVSDTAIGNTLKANGIEPAPQGKRNISWKTLLKAHWEVLAAVDVTAMEVWTKGGLVTYYLLFAMELATRRVCFAGCTLSPDGAWMKQMAKNLTDTIDGFLNGRRRFMRTAKAEALDRVILFGEDSLRRTTNSFIEHYHRERNHQGLANKLFDPGEHVGTTDGAIVCKERLGGIPRYYHRKAA